MMEIWGKSILVRVSKGLSYQESTVFPKRMRRIVKLNDHDEQREQPLHPSSIIELPSFLRILLLKIFSLDISQLPVCQ